jgi:hypothetical protein
MKLLENMKELGGTIHDAIQQMVNELFREELDDDEISEIVNKLSLSDILSLDAAYTAGNKEQVQDILGPISRIEEYNMGGGGAVSSASTRPTTAGAAKKTAAAAPKAAKEPASNYSGGNQNVAPKVSNTTVNNMADDDELEEDMDDMDDTTMEEYSEYDLCTADDQTEELEESDTFDIGNMSDDDLEFFHKKVPHGRYSSKEVADEVKRRRRHEPNGHERFKEEAEEETNIVEMTAWLKRRAGIDT